MSKRTRHTAAPAAAAAALAVAAASIPGNTGNTSNTTINKTSAHVEAFTFGDPEPVLDTRALWDYMTCYSNGQWFEPPVPFRGLAKSMRANSHHESAIKFKRNMLGQAFIPSPLLSRFTFSAFVQDYIVFGNAFIERQTAMTGRLLGLRHALALFTRRADNLTDYVYLPTGTNTLNPLMSYENYVPHTFNRGSIFHLIEPDINQEIYGMPEYLGALQSIWLNESATLFRRKYFLNGSHAGYILYINDPQMETADIDAIRDALKNSKGPGNFRNLFVHSAGGEKGAIQMIPIGEVTAKDEFLNIKNISRDDVLVAHRTPPQLLGLVPSNSGGFGDITKAARVYYVLEILPLQKRLSELNDWAGSRIVQFIDPEKIIALIEGELKARAGAV